MCVMTKNIYHYAQMVLVYGGIFDPPYLDLKASTCEINEISSQKNYQYAYLAALS